MKQGFGRSLRADCPFNPVEGAGFPFPSLTLRRNSCGTLPHLFFWACLTRSPSPPLRESLFEVEKIVARDSDFPSADGKNRHTFQRNEFSKTSRSPIFEKKYLLIQKINPYLIASVVQCTYL